MLTLQLPENAELVPVATVPHALDEVVTGTVNAALIPLENSVEGSVRISLDYLIASDHLMITREVLLSVTFDLYTQESFSLDRISTIATHPMAEAQCRQWVRDNAPEAAVITVASTADAANAVRRG
ncbi:MAG: prephenate dehydratase domain-containing protein, partial [Mycobacteriales bacterium]